MSRLSGIERSQRLSDEGLQRLQNHLQRGTRMSDQVLQQWIRRYGEAARVLIRAQGRYQPHFDAIPDPE